MRRATYLSKIFPAIGFSLVFLILSVPFLHAGNTSKKEILAKYEKAVSLAEEYHVYQKDVFHIFPKIELASKALLKNDFEQADRVLNEAFSDFEALKATKDQGIKTDFKLEWLEAFLDIFQHYAVLALLAYLWVHWPFLKAMLKKNRLSPSGKIVLSVLSILVAVVLGIFDLSRYGETAWLFFDIQAVLVIASGLLGGFGVGLTSGIGVAIFRWLLKPVLTPYLVVILVAGLLGGLFHKKLKSFQSAAKTGFFCGLLVGIIHGLIVYLPMRAFLTPQSMVFCISFLAILEGGGVALMMGVMGGILREETRRTLQYEFLKTRLLLLQSQLRPHFLFNALNTIAAICEEGDASKGGKLILRLSHFLRHTFDRKGEMVSLRQEMSFVDAFLEIESARFGTKLKVEKDFQISEKSWEQRIPMLVLQPLVENAIRHGISKQAGGGTVKIRVEETQEGLKFMVSDNGPGKDMGFFEALFKGKVVADDVGIGVRNIHERLLKLFEGRDGLYYESALGKGTSVTFEIPVTKEADTK